MKKRTIRLKKNFTKFKMMYTFLFLGYLRFRDKRWGPLGGWLQKEDQHTDLIPVFDDALVANHPSATDGVGYGILFHAVKVLVLHGIWRKRRSILIQYISTEDAGPKSGMWNKDSTYRLFYKK